MLEVFDNPSPERDFVDPHSDAGVYLPLPAHRPAGFRDPAPGVCSRTQLCVELKSLKQYVWTYRDVGAFHEAVTNKILDDLVGVLAPRFARLTAEFNVRGGVYTTVVAEHRRSRVDPVTSHCPAGRRST